MVTARVGRSRLGCLFALLLIVAGVHFGLGFGEAYLRYFRYRDAMAQAARFAGSQTDAAIRAHLSNVADSLGLPAEAHKVTIQRRAGVVSIESSYSEQVELPGSTRDIRFNPRVERK